MSRILRYRATSGHSLHGESRRRRPRTRGTATSSSLASCTRCGREHVVEHLADRATAGSTAAATTARQADAARRSTPARSRRRAAARPRRPGRPACRARSRGSSSGRRRPASVSPAASTGASGSNTRPCPAPRPSGGRRPGRGGRSRRGARRRGARPGCRSRRRARRPGTGRASQPVGDLDAEAVVAEEDVADPGHEHPSAALTRPPRSRRGGSTGSGPASRARPRPGRRRAVTATCRSPSTSWNTPATVAAMPARNMSWASARRAGPQPHLGALADVDAADAERVGPRVDRGVHRRVPPRDRGPRRSGGGRRGPDRPDGPVQPLEDLRAACRRHRSTMAAARASVPRASSLLLVGQREHPEGQDLVDLGGVAQVARALGGDLRVVVEDDRRRQHHVVRGAVADEHRERAVA